MDTGRTTNQTVEGTAMKQGDMKLMFDGRRNWAVELVAKVAGGWLVRLPNGMTVGPVVEGAGMLR